MRDLWSALVTWLRADEDLVALTTHTASDLRIYAWTPDADLKIPSLIVDCAVDELLVGRTVYDVKVRFESYHRTESVSGDIIERVRALLVSAATVEKRIHGPVADITDDTVDIKSCELSSIANPVWNQDMRYWSHELGARIIWAFV